MTTELATSASPVVAVRGDELSVSAATPNEMAQSQEALIEWAKRKVALTTQEADELGTAFEEAKKRKWKTSTLLRHYQLGLKRVDFYKKLLMALEHGYIIVPSFPVQVFAMRTTRDQPLKLATFGGKWDSSTKEQKANTLPAGVGEYKNPFPEVWYRDMTMTLPAEEQAKGSVRREYYANAWQEFEFPINMSKPNIMQATDRAMALKIFDDLGVLPGTRRNIDPIIVGRIKSPGSPKWAPRFVSFIIAWHLDTATL